MDQSDFDGFVLDARGSIPVRQVSNNQSKGIDQMQVRRHVHSAVGDGEDGESRGRRRGEDRAADQNESGLNATRRKA